MADTFSTDIMIRWADVDANRHVRHSAYFDFGATARMQLFNEYGFTTDRLETLQLGPILFREEAIYKRELRLQDRLVVDVVLTKAKRDFSRWSIRHTLYKNDDIVAAIINVDGAWIDIVRRKLTIPDPAVKNIFDGTTTSPDFQFIN